MSQQALEQTRNAKRLRVMADVIRQAQQQRKTSTAPQPAGYGAMGPPSDELDIAVIEDSDIYFVGSQHGRPPFYLSPKPEYFDSYETACRHNHLNALQTVLCDHTLTPAVLHHGLTLAVAAGSIDCVRELISKGSPITQRGAAEIFSAPRDKQIALLDAFTAGGTWTPSHDLFMRAIPDVELMGWFLSHGADPNYGINNKSVPSHECGEALEKAASAGSVEAIEALVTAGAKVLYGSPLHFAAGAASPGQDPNKAGNTQTEEFDSSRIPAMAALVAYGANVNQMDDIPHANSPGYPLLYAVRAGAIHRVRWLLEHGADLTLKGDYGSAAQYASAMGSEEIKLVLGV